MLSQDSQVCFLGSHYFGVFASLLINPEVSELCVYVTASECDVDQLVSLVTCRAMGQDLTMAMVPAEGVAADLSHLNMKCKVSLMQA